MQLDTANWEGELSQGPVDPNILHVTGCQQHYLSYVQPGQLCITVGDVVLRAWERLDWEQGPCKLPFLNEGFVRLV